MELKNITKGYNYNKVLSNIDIKIRKGKVLSILGPSGCGKTTILNIIAGIIRQDSGQLANFEGEKISYVFQEPRLLNHMTVLENIAFVINNKKNLNTKVIIEYLEQTGLSEYKDYYINELSGGMKQRVSLVRAFAYPSDIILMDEPFQSLDLQLKLNLISYFKKLWEKDRRTIIFVTHDITTSVLLGDDICILSDKPTKVKRALINKVPYNERIAYSNDILQAEKVVADILLNE